MARDWADARADRVTIAPDEWLRIDGSRVQAEALERTQRDQIADELRAARFAGQIDGVKKCWWHLAKYLSDFRGALGRQRVALMIDGAKQKAEDEACNESRLTVSLGGEG